MEVKTCSILLLVLLLSTAASAQAQDGPWNRLRGRISSFLFRTADSLDRDLATREALRGTTARSNATSDTTPLQDNHAKPPAQRPRKTSKATSPAAKLQQAQQCQARGQVTGVWCREDASGALQDIAYLNSATGPQTIGCSGQQQGGPDGASSSPYSKALFLWEDESIISVRACSNDRDGYTSVTFITDADKQFTCGSSASAGRNTQAAWTDDDTPELEEEEGDDTQWGAQVQAAAAGLNDTLLLNTSSGEPLRLQFVDHITAEEGADNTVGDREAQLQDGDSSDADNSSSEDKEAPTRASSRRAARRARHAHATARRAHTHHNHRAHRARASFPTQARLPGHLKKFFSESAEAITTTARSGRGSSAARTLLAQPQAVRTATSSNDNDATAAAPAPASAARTSAAAEPATWWWFDGHNGNNQPDSDCRLFTPDQAPIWASAQATTKGSASAAAAAAPPPPANTTKAYTRGGRGAESYLAFGNKRYFRNAATYAQQVAASKSSQQNQSQAVAAAPLGFEPAWFFDEVHPLAGLTLQCSSNGLASKVASLCWDSGLSPQPNPWGVDDVLSMTFESSDPLTGGPLTCPRTPSQVLALSRSLEVFGRQLAGSSGGVVGAVTWQQYTLDMCAEASMDRNTTITLGAMFAPAPGRLLLGVASWLLHGTTADLCDMSSNGLSVCEGTGIDSASHSIGFGIGQQAQQQRLASIQRLQDSLDAEQAREMAALQQVRQVQPKQLPQPA